MTRRRTARADQKALATLAAAGWRLIGKRPEHERWVAEKDINELDDDSTTRMFESSLTLEALAKQVERREREEGFVRKEAIT
jgi:hypothetical protein